MRQRALSHLIVSGLLIGLAACSQKPAETPRSTAQRVEPAPATTPAPVAGTPATNQPALARGSDADASTMTTYASASGIVPGKPTTIAEAYPDYHAGADDPENDAVKRGYRIVPKHDRTFETGGAASLEDVVNLVVSGIDRADGKQLDQAAVTYGDFRTLLWPEFPQSRPAAHVPVSEAWEFLRNRHMASFNRSAGEFHGKGLKVTSIKVGKVKEFSNFRLHDDIQVAVEDATGNSMMFPMIRTIVECHGRYKLYSTRD